jgi:hypothetical protein
VLPGGPCGQLGALWSVGVEGPVVSWGPCGQLVSCKADEIDEISNFHNLVHFRQKFGGDAIFLIRFFDRPNPPQ